MARRILAWVAAAVCSLGSLVACTPSPDPLLALRRNADDGLEALVYLCGGDHLVWLSVFDSDFPKGWRIEKPSDPSSPPPAQGAVSVYKIFVTPPGWSQTRDSLPGVESGHRYGISSRTRKGSVGELTLEAGDLGRLERRKVMVNDGGDAALVSESEFLRRAERACA